MLVKDLREFIKDLKDNDYVTICSASDDNPISDAMDVGKAYIIHEACSDYSIIVLLPDN